MADILTLRTPTLEFLFMALMLLCIGQALRLFLMVTRKEGRPLSLVTVYECSVLVLLALLMMAIYSSCILSPALRSTGLPRGSLWFGIVPLCLGIFLCIRSRRLIMVPTLIAFLALLPGITALIGLPLPTIGLIVCTLFVFRIAYGLSCDIERARTSVSRLSMKEAVDHLPEGLLFATHDGRPLVINDRMNAFLDALGVPINRIDTDRIWPGLEDDIGRGRIDGDKLGDGLLVRTPDRGTWFITFEAIEIPGHGLSRRHLRWRYTCMRAVDMTREDRLDQEIARVNSELERNEDGIRQALRDVATVARNEGILRMRSHVHDVIGQKLSILHRFLEDDDMSDAAVERIIPLLADLGHDLDSEMQQDRPAGIDDLVSSFALIGVDIVVGGEMPCEAPVAMAFSQVLREAATNAVRHGRARRVDVHLDDKPDETTRHVRHEMIISNDGVPPEEDVVEKTGLEGMRRVLADVGGTLRVETHPVFRLTAVVEDEVVS